MTVTGRVGLVTGGGRGIGRAVALALADAGLAVAVGARTRAQVEATAEELRQRGVASCALTLDVTDPVSVEEAVTTVSRTLGPVDVLVNNAGMALSAPFLETDLAHWDLHLRVNVTGAYLMTRAVLGSMLARGWGRVINVASLAGLWGAPYIAAYTASKHALVGLTRALATEVAGRGVTVNALCPGYTSTDMVWRSARHIAARTGRSVEEALAAMARLNPGGRLLDPGEVAAAAVRLVQDPTTNGQTIVLDGTSSLPDVPHGGGS